MAANETGRKKESIGEWLFRLVKGVLIGIGFIVPGLSGGVLAVIFGIYEPLMRFLGNLKEKFIYPQGLKKTTATWNGNHIGLPETYCI